MQIAMKEKRKAYKALKDGLGNQEKYKKWKKDAKRAVARAKERAWKEWHDNLETNEGKDKIYKIAKQGEKQKKDIVHMTVVKDKDKRVLTGEKEVKHRWKEYFEELLNIENERDDMEESELAYGPVDEFSVAKVKNAVESLKNGKAVGPTGITAEHLLDIEGIEWLTMLMDKIMEEGTVPVVWTRIYLIKIPW